MDNYDATEIAYKNGYAQGYEDGSPKWIPVSKRLPTEEDANEDGEVLVLHRSGLCEALFWDDVARYHAMLSHWMPLPEPPKT